MGQGNTRVIYETRAVDVPGYGGHKVVEIVAVQSGIERKADQATGGVKEGNVESIGQYKVSGDVGDLVC
ncbi:hypothetical protein HYV88_04695 [Candidatus Woesearchaeota archaeon]|nr:hypothetical protein [Candidatus Woesearchaeota archaeon]